MRASLQFAIGLQTGSIQDELVEAFVEIQGFLFKEDYNLGLTLIDLDYNPGSKALALAAIRRMRVELSVMENQFGSVGRISI